MALAEALAVAGDTATAAWVNSMLSDIASEITNSLERSGKGGMTGQFKAANGAVGAPGIAFDAEPTTGLYRAGAGDIRFAVGGADALFISAASKLDQVKALTTEQNRAVSAALSTLTGLTLSLEPSGIYELFFRIQAAKATSGDENWRLRLDSDQNLTYSGVGKLDRVAAGGNYVSSLFSADFTYTLTSDGAAIVVLGSVLVENPNLTAANVALQVGNDAVTPPAATGDIEFRRGSYLGMRRLA
jgi:hypothetical protein